MDRKKCFVIAPIGEDGSATRIRSNQILCHIIRPVAARFGFDVTRADEIAEPGIISTQCLARILTDPLVIADLTDRNPNVYYELAVRHAARRPVIQLMNKGEPLPFDVAGTRTIVVDHRDLDSVEDARKQLALYIEHIEHSGFSSVDSPISLAFDLQTLRESSDPRQAGLADIVERMTGVHGTVVSIQDFLSNGVTHRLDHLLRLIGDLKGHIGRGSTAGKVSDLRARPRITSVSRDPKGSAGPLALPFGSRLTLELIVGHRLSESVERLRLRLVEAVSNILGEIQERHSELARKIQSVFEEQSQTAINIVEHSFAEELAVVLTDETIRYRLLRRLVDVFMRGMKSMGTYQEINVTEQATASAHAIQVRINKSIEDVFSSIDNIEEQVIALPQTLSPVRLRMP